MSRSASPRESCSSSVRSTTGVAAELVRSPTSKETRVRVEGFWKISATLRPASAWRGERVRLERLRTVEQRDQLVAAELGAGEQVTAWTSERPV